MAKSAPFSEDVIEALRTAKSLGVRSGSDHRYTGVWPIVVEGRLFVRSWNDKPTGWFRAFKKEPDGTVQVGKLEIPVRARHVRSERLRKAVTAAYGQKYNTKGSRKWVDGFAEPERELTTLEFVPLSSASRLSASGGAMPGATAVAGPSARGRRRRPDR